jgi:hypothetical protein
MLLYNCPIGLEIDYIVINYNIIVAILSANKLEEALAYIDDFDALDEVASIFPDLARRLANPNG